ncbi:FAD/NAD(P)-binding protein [Pararhizobium sp. DWP3-4]|uniref:FAD/NAD(P)-binding protein n=1 Tax=unclassified Pararhizobium TaxID=2643050 RepID=UPI003CEFA414
MHHGQHQEREEPQRQSARNVDPLSASNIHPPVDDQRLACPALANIASIELPPVCESLTVWLPHKTPAELAIIGVQPETIGEREFYPRVVLGQYFQAELTALLAKAVARGHVVDVKGNHRVSDVKLRERDISVEVISSDGSTASQGVRSRGHGDWS